MPTNIRRAGVSLAAAATLLVASVGVATAQTATTEDPAEAAAGWLTTQLQDGSHVVVEFDGDEFPDQGLTADVVYALAATEVGGDHLTDAAAWLETQTELYTGPGASAKLLLAVDIAGGDVTDVGGVDLVDAITSLEADSGLYDGGEWNSTLNQALAVIALTRAGAEPSDAAVSFLLEQRCDDGGFRAEIEGEDCASHLDTTAFTAQALQAVGEDDALADATTWIADLQDADGSFPGDDGPSSNSTGLAALALSLTGEDGVADAQAWLTDQQAGCDTEQPGAILATPDGGGDALRATPQAVLGLVGTPLLELDGTDAAPGVPQLACDDAGDAGTDAEDADALSDDAEDADEDAADEANADEVAAEDGAEGTDDDADAANDAEADDDAAATEAAAEGDDGGIDPIVVGLIVLIVVALAGGAVVVMRRGNAS